MNRAIRNAVASTIFVLSATAASALADVTITLKDEGGERLVRFTPTHIRIEDDEPMIFDAEAQVMRVLQPSQSQYMEVTRDDLTAMGEQIQGAQGQIAAAMKQAEAAMANLPADQRAMIEEKMKAAMQSPAAGVEAGPRTRFAKAKGSETLLGVKCQKYQVFEGEELKGEAWIASPKDLGVSSDDLGVFHGFVEFMQALPKQMGWELNTFEVMDPQSDAFVGIPVRMTEIRDGKPGETMEIIKVEKGKLDSDLFAAPGDWKRVGPMDGIR